MGNKRNEFQVDGRPVYLTGAQQEQIIRARDGSDWLWKFSLSAAMGRAIREKGIWYEGGGAGDCWYLTSFGRRVADVLLGKALAPLVTVPELGAFYRDKFGSIYKAVRFETLPSGLEVVRLGLIEESPDVPRGKAYEIGHLFADPIAKFCLEKLDATSAPTKREDT